MSRNFIDYRKVEKIELDGRSFRSKAEVQMYRYLRELEKAGEVWNLRQEVRVYLLEGPPKEAVYYMVDFVVFDKASQADVYIEVKGFETDKWKIKVKLWRHFGPGPLRVYKVGWNRLDLSEEIIPKTMRGTA